MLEGWLSAVDVLVWLDAPDDVLWGRINERSQSHATKGRSFEEAIAFLGRYRALFAGILDRAEATGRPLVLRFDTSVTSPTEIALLIGPLVAGARTTAGEVRDAG
jgi:cytidylate kinase